VWNSAKKRSFSKIKGCATMTTREKLEQEFVNIYRKAWNSNEGLTSQRIKSMTNKQLKESIESLKRFSELKKDAK
jgi:hypothetical protein